MKLHYVPHRPGLINAFCDIGPAAGCCSDQSDQGWAHMHTWGLDFTEMKGLLVQLGGFLAMVMAGP